MIKGNEEIKKNLKDLFAINARLDYKGQCIIEFKKDDGLFVGLALRCFDLTENSENIEVYKTAIKKCLESNDNCFAIQTDPGRARFEITSKGLRVPTGFKDECKIIRISGNESSQKPKIENFIKDVKVEINNIIEMLIKNFEDFNTLDEDYVDALNINLND